MRMLGLGETSTSHRDTPAREQGLRRRSQQDSNTESERPREELREPLYKRPLDLSILIAAHVLLFPLWLALWILIPLAILVDSGRPLFYRHRRVGKNGKVFDAYKFRTMENGADQSSAIWTTENDARVTRVGRALRNTALDELPQLINILKGEMSFVGPRGLGTRMYGHSVQQVPNFERRLAVRPGLTGMAQVYGNRDDPAEKLSHDLEYVRKMNLWLDVKLIALSVWITLRGTWEKRGRKF